MSEQTIQFIGGWSPQIDFELAAQFLRPLPGRTVVEMQPVPQRVHGVLLAGVQGHEHRNTPDIGMVLAAGKGVPLLPGDIVAVDHEHGKRMSGCVFGDYEAHGEVRMYGCAAQSGGNAIKVSWRSSILATIDSELFGNVGAEFTIEGVTEFLRPVEHMVLIQRDDLNDVSPGGVHLPDSASYRSSEGTVLAVGGFVRDVKVGDRVIYMASLVKKLDGKLGPNPKIFKNLRAQGITDKNLVLIEDAAILTVVIG